MKVAVIGAGALGSVYGVRLALRGGVDVELVVRRAKLAVTAPIRIEAVRGGARESIEAPARVDVVSPDADVILLAVGTDDLDAISNALGGSSAPLVILTPMMPNDWQRVRAFFGDRAHAAMPGVVAYTRNDDVVRYWTPPAPTKIDEPRSSGGHSEAVRELAASLSRAGLTTRFALGVHETNPATTVCFIPIAMAIAIAGSVEALSADEALLALVAEACRDGSRLAQRIGAPELWASLAPAFAAPWALRLWPSALGKLSPEAIYYADEHFGRKLVTQHRVMIHEMIELAAARGLPRRSFEAISARLAALDERHPPRG